MSISSKQDRRDKPSIGVPKEHRQEWREFMRDQIALPESDQRWRGMCESLQRQAHGKPARFASAYAHMVATPMSERMDPREAPRTAFIFVDDENDSNAWGHIVGKWDFGDGTLDGIPVVTNDVNDRETDYDPGNVTVVPLGWFPRHWGDSIKFATLWFGGDDIPTFDPTPSPKEDTAKQVQRAINRAEGVIEMMKKAIRDNDGKEHPRHEKALRRELSDQREIIADLKKLLP
jgi:hypothetical protein